jgi:adenosylcobyric acid synthase
VVVATAEAGDEEMAERIRRHREERPPTWTTVEEPLDLEGALRGASDDALVLVDCLTLWVSNLLGRELPDDDVEAYAARAATVAADRAAGTIAVTNEVGSSIVPDNPLGRRFRDLSGRVNGLWADAAERAALVVAGRLLPLVRPEDVDGWTLSS